MQRLQGVKTGRQYRLFKARQRNPVLESLHYPAQHTLSTPIWTVQPSMQADFYSQPERDSDTANSGLAREGIRQHAEEESCTSLHCFWEKRRSRSLCANLTILHDERSAVSLRRQRQRTCNTDSATALGTALQSAGPRNGPANTQGLRK